MATNQESPSKQTNYDASKALVRKRRGHDVEPMHFDLGSIFPEWFVASMNAGILAMGTLAVCGPIGAMDEASRRKR